MLMVSPPVKITVFCRYHVLAVIPMLYNFCSLMELILAKPLRYPSFYSFGSPICHFFRSSSSPLFEVSDWYFSNFSTAHIDISMHSCFGTALKGRRTSMKVYTKCPSVSSFVN